MEKKYQIFISSTYEDLKDERDQAIKAVLEMGHIPVGMEMFSAADEEQWQLIARQIESSDYYIIILAHRYGSETPEGISYTEKEYDYAKSCGIPVLGFIINKGANWPANYVDKETNKKKKNELLKSKVKSKLVNFWETKEDLHGKISISLVKSMTTNPRVGWSRSDELNSINATREIIRLSEENSILRKENEKLKNNELEPDDSGIKTFQILNKNDMKFRVRSEPNWDTAERFTKTLLEIFLYIAPNLLSENTTKGVADNIAYRVAGNKKFHIWPIGKSLIEHLMAQLAALELVEPSKKKHPVSDKETYWTLTTLGKQVQKRSIRIQLEAGIDYARDESEDELTQE